MWWADAKWGEVGRAFVSLGQGEEQRPTAQELLDHCRSKLAKYKVPKELIILDELPKGASGKIQKADLT